MQGGRPTANDRFKASWGRTLKFGLLSAALLEIAILAFAPAFSVPVSGIRFRMIVVVDTLTRIDWPKPAGETGPDAALIPPRLDNIDAVQLRLHQQYPPDLWRMRIENAATVRISIDARGTVDAVELIEPGDDPAADAGIVRLAAMMRFEPARVDGRRVAVQAVVRISIEEPLPPRRMQDRRPRSTGRLL